MRNGFVDVVRFLGALGIVWFHAGAAESWIGHSALLVFLVLAVFFLLESSGQRPVAEVARSRGRRLLIPFLAWSGVFFVAKSADALVRGRPLGAEFHPWMILTGPSLHLWFLPFLFVAGLIVVCLDRLVADWRLRTALHLALSLGFLALLAAAPSRAFEPPIGEWRFSLPAIFVGAALHGARGRAGVELAVGAAFIAAVALMMPHDTTGQGRSQALAVVVVLASLRFFLPAGPVTAWLALVSFGIYLVHPLVLAAVQRIAPPDAAAVALLTMAGATLCAAALLRSPLRRFSI